MTKEGLEWVRRLVLNRRVSYRALFMPSGAMTPASEVVLNDLRAFCRATSSPAQLSKEGMVDPIATGVAIGRLEVWLRISQNLHLSDADLYRLVERSQQDGTD